MVLRGRVRPLHSRGEGVLLHLQQSVHLADAGSAAVSGHNRGSRLTTVHPLCCMTQEGVDLSANPLFNNALVLDLLSWDIVSRAEADNLFINPWKDAERVERTGLRAVISAKVLFWQEEFSSSTSEVVRRWPHTVYSPIS